MRVWLVIISLVAASAAYAQFNGCRAGFCPGGIGMGLGVGPSPRTTGGGGATNFLLSNGGSALLVNTDSKFLIQ